MRNIKRIATATMLFACIFSTRASAQQPTASASPKCLGGDKVVVADLGFSFECSCVFRPHVPGGPAWDFRSEPRITEVGQRGPARGVLKDGDILVAIDGKLITTREGGERFARARDGDPVVLTIRRDGRQLTVKFSAQQSCLDEWPPTPSTPPSAAPAAPAIAPAPPAAAARPYRRTPSTPAPAPEAAPAQPGEPPEPPGAVYAPGAAPTYPESFPLAWFGFGLSCGDCGFSVSSRKTKKGVVPQWKFNSSPEIYSVDAGSPAGRAGLRRGDILVDIDGIRLTTPTGSRRFSDVVPGQRVRLSYRRGAERHSVAVIAERRPEFTAANASYSRLARELQAAQRALGHDTLRGRVKGESVKLDSLRTQLLRLQRQEVETMYRTREDAANATRTYTYSPGAVVSLPRSAQRLRYSGSIGGADVEVRGVGTVVVNSTGDEITITTGDTTVRIHASTKKQ